MDINVLLYAVDAGSSHHAIVKPWLTKLFNQPDGVALCWPVISGFIRIGTNAKVLQSPMTIEEACDKIHEWLALPGTRLINSSSHHWRLFSGLLKQTRATGNLVSDSHLAALAIEHGLELASCDTDFAKFPGLRWINPLKP
ncbi:MAG: type II toxin-antitoxin system VapC family toxin [Prosthecobacter sp.]|nr:type II toxin-antitoxin system VapC family toxin [Prosthecobacter sp.]